MSIPNPSPATAIAITLPFNQLIDTGAIPPDEAAWYKATCGTCVSMLSIRVTPIVDRGQGVEVFLADGVTQAPGEVFADLRDPIQQGVIPGEVRYFKVWAGGEEISSELTRVQIAPAPSGAVPAGSLLIPDDTFGFAALILSATTGAVIRAASMPHGEYGDTNPSGVICLESRDVNDHIDAANFYDSNFNLIISIPPPTGSNRPLIIAADQVDKFYFTVLGSPPTSIWRTDEAGNIDAMTWTPVGDINFMAVGIGGGTIYWSVGGVEATVETITVGTNAAGPQFAAGVAGFFIFDIVTLPGGSLIVAYAKISDRTLDFVRHYAVNGATLMDYPVKVGFHHDHICRISGDDTAFWWWTQQTNTLSNFRKIRLSDGALLADSTVVMFSSGYAQDPLTDQLFGPSPSCPFLSLVKAALACTPAVPLPAGCAAILGLSLAPARSGCATTLPV